jgi:MFS family permease
MSSFTLYGWAVCSWALINAFQVPLLLQFIIYTAHLDVWHWQYGYHTSALNQLQAVLSCKIPPPHKTCIPMSDVTFSVVASIFTVGGLAGSLFANLIMDKWGRRGAHRICALLIALGSAFMGLSNSVFFLLVGR